MKLHFLLLAALTGAAVTASTARAADPERNRVSLSLRVPFNIQARFSGAMTIGAPAVPRTTPNGATYNYDDGYVFNDVSGSGDGLTWYWGYDDSASQVDGANNAVLLSRATGNASLSAPDMDGNGALGFELAYNRDLFGGETTRFGFEATLNYVGLSLDSSASYRACGTRVVDSFAFTPGTTPPGASPGSGYQGTFNGPGFVIGNTPFRSTTTLGTPVGTVTGSRNLDATLWGTRIGPTFEWHFAEKFSLTLSGGLAIGLVDVDASWNETLTLDAGGTFTDTGSGSDNDLRLGFYAAAGVVWNFTERWSVVGGAQYQNLGKYTQSFGSRTVELDLSKSIFVTLGIGYSF